MQVVIVETTMIQHGVANVAEEDGITTSPSIATRPGGLPWQLSLDFQTPVVEEMIVKEPPTAPSSQNKVVRCT
jgi:hypothetical protein